MRTYNVQFKDEGYKGTIKFETTDEQFRVMRRFILHTFDAQEKLWVCTLVDKCDEIKALPVGESIYIVSARKDAYSASTLEGLNNKVALMDRLCADDANDGHQPQVSSAFRVKRTPKRWILNGLDYDIV